MTRATEYEWLLRRHSTRQQAAFFLETRGQSLDPVLARHEAFQAARADVLHAHPPGMAADERAAR